MSAEVIIYVLVGILVVAVVLPLLAFRLSKAIAMGWFRGKQIQKEIERDGDETTN